RRRCDVGVGHVPTGQVRVLVAGGDGQGRDHRGAARKRAVAFPAGFSWGESMAKKDPALEWLDGVALFQDLPKRDLRVILESMVERDFKAGDLVVQEGDAEGRFYLITEGKASVVH